MVLEFFGDFSFARIYELSLNLKCAPLRERECVRRRRERGGWREGRSSSFVLRCVVMLLPLPLLLLWTVYRVRF